MKHQGNPLWGIRQGLEQEINSPYFLPEFGKLRQGSLCPGSFRTSEALVKALQDQGVDQKVKNRAITFLVEAYQKGEKKQQSGILSILLLGLWDKMEETHQAYYCRLRFLADPFSEVYAGYLVAIAEIDCEQSGGLIERIQNQADNFVRNTIRDECRHKRLLRKLKQNVHKSPEQVNYTGVTDWLSDWVIEGVITREQKELVLQHAIYDRTFRDLGNESGTSAEAIRKRYNRAIEGLKEYLKDKVSYDYRGRPYLPKNF